MKTLFGNKAYWLPMALMCTACTSNQKGNDGLILEKLPNANHPRNVIFILSDDHRLDFMDFIGKAASKIEGIYIKKLSLFLELFISY